MTEMGEAVRAGLGSIGETISERLAEVKPKLRGWLHLGTTPLALAAGIVLISLAPDGRAKVGATVFIASSLLLFGVSATYHRFTWSTRMHAFLKRWDHANIFVLIAGTYTPFSLLLLHGASRVTLLVVVWTAAVLGVFFRIFWNNAPRWLYVPMYLALGWAAVFFIPGFLHGATRLGVGIGVATFVLICVGGALYTMGSVVYGFRKPNPWPKWFGFHEVFHTFTVFAFAAHYTGISLATYALRR